MKVVLGSSNYARKKQVTIYTKLYCDNCKKESENVIHTDTSDNEYGGLSLCEKCIYQLIDNFKKGNFKPITECKLCHENFEVIDPKEVNVNDKLCEYCMRHYEYKSKLLHLNFNTIDDYLEYEKIRMNFSFVLMYINKHKYKHKNNNEDYKDNDEDDSSSNDDWYDKYNSNSDWCW